MACYLVSPYCPCCFLSVGLVTLLSSSQSPLCPHVQPTPPHLAMGCSATYYTNHSNTLPHRVQISHNTSSCRKTKSSFLTLSFSLGCSNLQGLQVFVPDYPDTLAAKEELSTCRAVNISQEKTAQKRTEKLHFLATSRKPAFLRTA